MAEWWQSAYKGGPAISLPGFPRPLHYSGAPGYSMSADGPDVVAYKRIVSRLGRWPWQAFDDTYSMLFALGKAGGMVGDSGVAGVQRQQGWDDTGYVGERFWSFCRNALVPEQLPNGGEHAMDAVAQNLLIDAWHLFGAGGPVAGSPLSRKAIPSPNYSSRSGAKVRLIVLHTAEGARTIEDLGHYFQSTGAGVSSHVGIDDTPGTIGEYVQPANKAWTQGNANPVAVSAELCAFAEWTPAEWDDHQHMLDNCARWIREEAERFGLPLDVLTPSQAQGSGRGVCQHADLGSWGGGHWDCGDSFPIDEVMRRARS